jgi:hypothetical protein
MMKEDKENETGIRWGTWEELLLACAVKRHGFKDWDSVAMELRLHSFNPTPLPLHCMNKFHDLKRRFSYSHQNDDVHHVAVVDDGGGDNDNIPWLDELRKRRVAELKRDLQRYDLNIM